MCIAVRWAQPFPRTRWRPQRNRANCSARVIGQVRFPANVRELHRAAWLRDLAFALMSTSVFDLGGLYRDLAAARERRSLSWAGLAREVGVSPSTIRRLRNADDAEADGVLAVICWLGVTPEQYVQGDVVKPERLRDPGHGLVRVDMNLVAEADGDAHGARGRSRTSIQRLVESRSAPVDPWLR